MRDEWLGISGAAATAFLKFNRVLYISSKRVFDIICAIIGCIALLPLALVVKISYMLSGDFNSIFFTQNRIGQYGKEFKFYKFRSMIPNADDALFKILRENKDLAREYKINKKLRDDPRITKMGRILRKTSLDELPQVINVLKGEMSIIGNRPYLPREKEDMGEHFGNIVKTKPGITGYWQVSGRSDTTFEKRLELEEHYSQYASFKIDIKIFFKTFQVVLGTKGAE
ncbi:MAG: sugar transferase [Bacilli bacterium]|nr:sugar transferase [Bacilli bacterium]